MRNKKKFSTLSISVEVALIALALLSGYFLFLEFTTNLTGEQIEMIDIIDLGIAVIFLCDFGVKLYLAEDRRKFFRTRWWELLAAIPVTTQLTQGLRLLRVLRLLHLVEAVAD